MLHTYGYVKLQTGEDDLLKIAKDSKSEKKEAQKAMLTGAAIGTSAAAAGGAGGAYVGSKATKGLVSLPLTSLSRKVKDAVHKRQSLKTKAKRTVKNLGKGLSKHKKMIGLTLGTGAAVGATEGYINHKLDKRSEKKKD
jgi:hypothetical protein